MKHFLTYILLAILSLSVTAKDNDLYVKPQIKEVLVFLQNAQVTSKAEVNLVPGTFNIVLQELSQYIDENSVQVKGDADFTILSVVV
jgi:hypothetical protein